jgi:phosphogluconate dehydratase
MAVHPRIAEVTRRIVERSRGPRGRYLEMIQAAALTQPERHTLGCANQAHGFAACGPEDKAALRSGSGPNLGIVTAYNDMLSAHQPFERFPELIRAAAREVDATAQVAGGVPAMCDGVTQGEPGMELSLFSREVIALSTAVALSHRTFDAALFLGVCDKIVPGLVIGALRFGHLPSMFLPAGPMTSGLSNDEKSRIRQLHAEGKVGRDALLEAEAASYHGPGTCTFYGTANTNQMLMEILGLHPPGSTFVNPGTPLRDAIVRITTQRVAQLASSGPSRTPLGTVIDERAIVNGIVGLHATGGSTNHTLHLVAMAAAGGIHITWDDLADIAEVVPLLCRIYPNGKADVNHFHAAGGMGFLIGELLRGGLLHEDVTTAWGTGLAGYLVEPRLDGDGGVRWEPAATRSGDTNVLRGLDDPFHPTGGLRVLRGSLGQAVMKTSAVPADRHFVEAPARVFDSQEGVQRAFKAGEFDRDVVVVVRFQGPQANGMPELHKLMPPLSALQDRGLRVALVTDGRLSGASGKVPGAIHVTPEALAGGAIGRVRDGDIVRVDGTTGRLEVLVSPAELAARESAVPTVRADQGVGRELFAPFRAVVGTADTGASIFSLLQEP